MTHRSPLFMPGPDMDKLIEAACKVRNAEALSKYNDALQKMKTLEQKLSNHKANAGAREHEMNQFRSKIKALTKENNSLRAALAKAEKAKRDTPPAPAVRVDMKPSLCRICGGPHYSAYCEDAA